MTPDRPRRRLLTSLALLLAASTVVAAQPSLPADVHENSALGRDILFVVLFSLPDCPYCVAVRKAYLPALLDDPRFAGRVRIREIGIGNTHPMKGFKGERLSQAEMARRYGIRFAPTVLFLDGAGTPRAEPLVGGDSVGLYAGSLENRVLQGLGLLPGKN